MHRSRFLLLALLALALWIGPIQDFAKSDQRVRTPNNQALDQDTKSKTDDKDSPLDRRPDVVYWPTPQNVVDKMLELAEVKKGDLVYDLGCGDARILVTAAKKFGVKGFGYDIDPERIKDS